MADRESSTIALAPDSELAARLAEAGSSGAPLLVDAAECCTAWRCIRSGPWPRRAVRRFRK